jgi:formylglycine-generating enzyme required for sulfatase activity
MQPTLYAPSPTIQRRLRAYTANGHTFHMVAIEKGTFLMQGDHEITFKEDFELGQYPVTQALWEAVMGENPSRFKGADRPVENVSWDDINGTKEGVKKGNTKGGFLDRLNALPEIAALNAKDGCRFALPTEAQWEYAARGGRYGAAFPYKYAGSNYLPEVGWYRDNSQVQSQSIGRKMPNVLGLYDMSGNALEWCEDVWHNDYKNAPKSGSAWTTSDDKSDRVVRGGSWNSPLDSSGVASQNGLDAFVGNPFRGFRLSRYRVTP